MFILLTLLVRHVASSATPSSDTIPTATASTPTTSQRPTTTGGGVPAPTQTQEGANPSCQKWYVVVRGDGCWAIANTAGIALEDFYKWNPGVGECANLYPDYAVCVGI
jgi:LysM repeat protein